MSRKAGAIQAVQKAAREAAFFCLRIFHDCPNVQRSRSFAGAAVPAPVSAQQVPVAAQPQPQRPAAQPQPPRATPSFSNSDDLDIPPFLRNRNRGR